MTFSLMDITVEVSIHKQIILKKYGAFNIPTIYKISFWGCHFGIFSVSSATLHNCSVVG